MKAFKSNTRIAFAYQERESVAAELNPALNSTGSGYIVRVVQPSKSPVELVLRHPDYSSSSANPVEHSAIDRLLSAYITGIKKEKNPLANETIGSFSANYGIVSQVSTVQAPSDGEPVIIDLKLNTFIQSTDWESELKGGHAFIVAIRLMFESGVEETLDLYLKASSHLFLSIDPRDLTIGDEVTIGAASGSQVTPGGTFSAYNIAKCYRKIEDRGKAIPSYYGISRRNNSSDALWTSYTQPWGFIRDTPTSGLTSFLDTPTDLSSWSLSSPSWATDQDAFVTNHKSSLSWFSGNSDMSATYIDSDYWSGTSPNHDIDSQPIDLRKFFEFKAPWKHASASSNLTKNLIWPQGLPKWGQRFGWHSNFTGSWLHKVSGDSNNATYFRYVTQTYGLPLKTNYSTQDSLFNSQSNNFDFKQGDTFAPPMFNGNFNVPNTNPAGAGDFGFPTNANFGNNTFSYSIGGIVGPQAARIRKYLVEQGDGGTDVSNTYIRSEQGNLPSSGGLYTKLTYLWRPLVPAYNDQVSTNNSFIRLYELEEAKKSYYFTPVSVPSVIGSTTIFSSGSVESIAANNAVNFFYAGGATDGNEHLEPIFKGYIRNFTIARYGQASGLSTLAALPHALAAEAINNGAEFAQNMDLRGIIAGVYATEQKATARFNAIDILANLLWNSHSIKPTFEYGDLVTADPASLVDKTADSVLRSYGLYTLATKWDGGTTPSLGSEFEIAAQDIAFINSAVNTTGDANPTLDTINGFHPIGSPLSRIGEVYNNPPTPVADANAVDLGESNIQVSPIVRGLSTYYNEITGTPLGVFSLPVAGTPSVDTTSTYRNNKFQSGPTGISQGYGSPFTASSLSWSTLYPLPLFPMVNFESADIIAVGTTQTPCLFVKKSSTTYQPVSPTTSLGQGEQYHKITYQMVYENTCSGAFQDSGSYTVTGGTLAQRVAGVLNIFPHIEFNALAAYKPAGIAPDVNELQLAYTIIVTDENDVDDIKIELVTGSTYKLTIEFTQGDSDVYNSPDDDIEDDITIPGTQFWPDTPIILSGTGNPYDYSSYSELYGEYEGSSDYNKHKGSYITISTNPDWRNDATASHNQAAVLGTNEMVYHHSFLTFGSIRDVDVDDAIDESTTVLGCTDADAVNYNPAATEDDDSCYYCEDEANGKWNLAEDGLVTSTGGVRPGVYDDGYLFGTVGGNLTQSSVGFTLTAGNDGYGTYFSPGATYGGAVIADNDYLGSTASVNLSVRTGTISANTNFTGMLGDAETYGNGVESWRLRIIPASDALLDIVDLTNSYSANNPAPATLTGASAIYTADASAGTIYAPEWNDISTPASPLAGLNAGVPYLLELKFQPKNLPAGCTTYASGDAIVYGLFWVGFCSCTNTTNEYFSIAMGGQGYAWNSANISAFPIVDYSTSFCPDTVNPNNYSGDNDYPASICFTADDQSTSCDNFFLWCVAVTESVCDTGITSLAEAYQEGDLYYYDYFTYTATLLYEGAYNSSSDSYVFDANTSFVVNMVGPDGYNTTLTNSDAVIVNADGGTSNALQLLFENMTAPGEYEITWTFTDANGVYDTFYGDYPCVYTETINVLAPSTICPEIVPGCTDPAADNYDANANFDDGSCTYIDPCTEIYNNTLLTSTATSVNSDSQCVGDTIQIGNTTYTTEVPVPDNNGSITVTTEYDAPAGVEDGGEAIVSQFSILIFPTSSTIPGLSDIVDSTSALFSAGIYPTSTTESTSLVIDGETIGVFSPLFNIAGSDSSFNYTFSNLAPNTYNFLAIPNLGNIQLNECTDEPLIRLEEYIDIITVGWNDPANPCEESCEGSDCGDAVPGCTDPDANNYDPTATYNNGTCEYDSTFCEENSAHELCITCLEEVGAAPARFASGALDETICDPTTGSDGECTDPNACNYNPDAPLESSNNQICDYCSCVGPDDLDCNDDSDCDPDVDPDCAPPEPECPDPGNPNCDPIIADPCPNDECGPPVPPCVVLGNCPPNGGGGDDPTDPFEWDEPIIELTCIPQVAGVSNEEEYFDSVIKTAFKCMSDEGKKMLFRMKAGAQYSDEDLIKLSLIAYLLNGGADFSDLPCIFNCNYDSLQRSEAFDGREAWANKGAKFWASTDTYAHGDIVIYYNYNNGKVKRSMYQAARTVTPQDLRPPYSNSGWHRVKSVRVRTQDTNGIASGEETYLQTFWEFLTRFCTSCEVSPNNSRRDARNDVDPTILKNHLDPKVERNINTKPSGILGEDGDEIIF